MFEDKILYEARYSRCCRWKATGQGCAWVVYWVVGTIPKLSLRTIPNLANNLFHIRFGDPEAINATTAA